jgi:uncharacterized protein with beta-barrel porin domain
MFDGRRRLGVLAVIFATLAIGGIGARAAAQRHTLQQAAMSPEEFKKAKIARAMSAAPPAIAKDATIVELNFLGKRRSCVRGPTALRVRPAIL